MSHWTRNDWATAEMRRDPLCPPDACVYDNGPLRAFVLYTDFELMPGLRWHIVLGSVHGKPDMEEARAAWDALLPGIDRVCYLPAKDHAGENAIHICELVPDSRRGLQ